MMPACKGETIVLPAWPLQALVPVVGGVFSLYEAVRGWCIMRACGIKTKI